MVFRGEKVVPKPVTSSQFCSAPSRVRFNKTKKVRKRRTSESEAGCLGDIFSFYRSLSDWLQADGQPIERTREEKNHEKRNNRSQSHGARLCFCFVEKGP